MTNYSGIPREMHETYGELRQYLNLDDKDGIKRDGSRDRHNIQLAAIAGFKKIFARESTAVAFEKGIARYILRKLIESKNIDTVEEVNWNAHMDAYVSRVLNLVHMLRIKPERIKEINELKGNEIEIMHDAQKNVYNF